MEPRGCEGWIPYTEEMNATVDSIDSRLELLRAYDTLSDDQLRGIANAFSTDLANMRALEPPENAQALNDQVLVLLQGWRNVVRAMQNGTFTDQMLYDLQREDDETERLLREANAACVT
jgi:hypothetical protein